MMSPRFHSKRTDLTPVTTRYRIITPRDLVDWAVGFICIDPEDQPWEVLHVSEDHTVLVTPIIFTEHLHDVHYYHWRIAPDDDEIPL